MKSKSKLPTRFSVLPCIAAAAFIPSVSFAGDYTWDGGFDGSWIVGTNWVGNPNGAGVPTHGIGSTQTFYATGAANLTTFLGAGRNVGTLNFDANADGDVSIRFATTAAGATIANLTMDASTGNAAIGIDSNAAGNFILGVTGGSMILNDNLVITHNGTGNLTINRPISTGASFTTGLTKDGTGTLTLTAANNFNGGFILNAGTLNINGLNSLGGTAAIPSTVTINGGTIDNTSGASITISTKLHAYAFNGNFSFKGTNALSLSTGAVSLGTSAGTARTITTDAGTLTIGGIISDGTTANSLTKDGLGTLTLSGTNAYTGSTVVKAGTLRINTSTSIATSSSIVVGDAGSTSAVLNATTDGLTVGSTQTLEGIGTVNGTGKTVTISGSHAVGNAGTAGGVGTQIVTATTLTYGAGSIFEWDINTGSATYDKVALTGSLTVDSAAIFKVVSSTAFSDGFWNSTREWTDIFGANSLGFNVANFLYVANGATVSAPSAAGSFSISGNTLTWTAVPEPTSALAGLLLGVGILRRRRG